MRIRVGLAGWSNPPAKRLERAPEQTHLSFYAAHFSCVEINSSFYRPHQQVTYTRWRDETPAAFRFFVKMPRLITHESRLRRCAKEVSRFYEDIAGLQPKLAGVLIQLPPSLEFNGRIARMFLKSLPQLRGTKVVCEPRHPSWFTRAAENALREARVSRVAADPARCPGAEAPGGMRRFAYFRWHGAPYLYYSKYSDAQLAAFAEAVTRTKAAETWCVFDNTARYAAWDDALQLTAALRALEARTGPSALTDVEAVRRRHPIAPKGRGKSDSIPPILAPAPRLPFNHDHKSIEGNFMKVKTAVRRATRAIGDTFSSSDDAPESVDILDTLKKEHDEVKDLLESLSDAETSAQRRTLVVKIKAALVPHTKAEEKVVYDAVIALRDKDAQQDGHEGYLEHEWAAKTLQRLESIANAASPEHKAAGKVLKELVEHHIEEEESSVWNDVKEHFSDEDRKKMNVAFHAAKRRVKL
jgi:uncharacterized protein YecE (DUF72 family)